jgi:cellobiose transport system substrate-binding protein
MTLSRRSLLRGAGWAGRAGAASLAAASCSSHDGGSGAGDDAVDLTFWYWDGALSNDVVKDVSAGFRDRATITTTIVPGDFAQRLTTALSSGRSVPDVTGVKGEDMPVFLTQAERFLDLNTLGAKDIAAGFAAAKYAQATTPQGKQVGLPIDLGPTALFLRADLWRKAGLPAEPAAVTPLMSTWDGWFDVGARLKKALPGTFLVRNAGDVFGVALAQQPETFITRGGEFAGDRGGVKTAWDIAVRAITAGLQAGIYDNTAFNAALAAGTITGHLGPAWNGLDIASGAPGTSGAWRVAACPGGPANIGGSFLTLPSACRAPETAFAYVSEILSPANEGKGFTDASVFPAVTAAYRLPALTRGQEFYGGQATIEVFGPAAEHLPVVYDAPLNAAITASYATELSNIEGGKDPAKAWVDAVTAGKQTAGESA